MTCIDYLFLVLVYVGFAHHSCCHAEVPDNAGVIYIDCKNNDTIEGESLASIIGYVIKGINTTSRQGQEISEHDKFLNYCHSLGERLGGYDPYTRKLELGQSEKTSKEEIVQNIIRALPRTVPEFRRGIELVAEKAMKARVAAFRVDGLVDIFYRKQKYAADLSEFVVIKIFRSAENLEIIPCLLKLSCKGEAIWFFGIPTKEKSELLLHYEERRYILTKFNMKSIIQNLRESAGRSWS